MVATAIIIATIIPKSSMKSLMVNRSFISKSKIHRSCHPGNPSFRGKIQHLRNENLYEIEQIT